MVRQFVVVEALMLFAKVLVVALVLVMVLVVALAKRALVALVVMVKGGRY